MSIENIKRTLARADAIDYREGLQAYHNYNRTAQGLADYYGYPLEVAAAVFVALSPNNDYIKNLRSTATLMKGHSLKMPVESLTVSTYKACKLRAWRVLNGENFLDFTKGKKTRNFYLSVVDPKHESAVTIDGHMVNIYHGKVRTMKEVINIRPRWRYDDIAHDYRRVAFSEFVLPSQLQAILWFTWKRVHKIVYEGNYELFATGDEWRMRWKPEDVKPYYI